MIKLFLQALYQMMIYHYSIMPADLFVYPSSYEGFGLPHLEAMSCNTPVITSNITSIPEVTNDSAVFIDPFDKADLSCINVKIIKFTKPSC